MYKNQIIKGAFIAATAAVALQSSLAHAAITLLDEQRNVSVSGSVSSNTLSETWGKTHRSEETFGVFNSSLDEARTAGENMAGATAAMNSNITTNGITASGSTSSAVNQTENTGGYSNRNNSTARSEAVFEFELSERTFFDLSLSLFNSGEASSRARGGATASLRNLGYNTPTYNLSFGDASDYDGFEQEINLSGWLDAGSYVFRALATSSGDDYGSNPSLQSSNASFNASLLFDSNGNWSSSAIVAAPVPGAAWLFGSALMMLVAKRRV